MDEKIYTVTLADGTEIGNLRLNGNNYISQSEVDPAIFTGNCSPVTISNGENSEVHENMDLVQVTRMGTEYWFVLRDLSTDEMEKIRNRSDLEYLAMLTGVEL